MSCSALSCSMTEVLRANACYDSYPTTTWTRNTENTN
jgi:hypothetical protein